MAQNSMAAVRQRNLPIDTVSPLAGATAPAVRAGAVRPSLDMRQRWQAALYLTLHYDLSLKQSMLLHAIAMDDGINGAYPSQAELARVCGLPVRTAKYHLRRLRIKGAMRTIRGRRRTALYIIDYGPWLALQGSGPGDLEGQAHGVASLKGNSMGCPQKGFETDQPRARERAGSQRQRPPAAAVPDGQAGQSKANGGSAREDAAMARWRECERLEAAGHLPAKWRVLDRGRLEAALVQARAAAKAAGCEP